MIIRLLIIVLPLVCALPAFGSRADCAFGPRWEAMSDDQKDAALREPKTHITDASCFEAYLTRIQSNRHLREAISFAQEHAGDSLVNLTALIRLASLDSSSSGNWERLVSLWERRNGSLLLLASKAQQAGRPKDADRIMRLLSRTGKLRGFDYLRWAQIKQIVGDYDSATDLFCKASTGENHLGVIAQSQLLQMLQEADSIDLQKLLTTFEQCVLSSGSIDTLIFRNWLVDAYNRFELFDEAYRVLLSLNSSSESTHQELLRMSQMHFANKQFDQALRAARLAYEGLTSNRWRSICASTIYQAFVELGQTDSALRWIQRSGLTDTKRLHDAIVLYQISGDLQKSGNLLVKLPSSRDRDSLEIRQALFQSNPQSAVKLTQELSGTSRWKSAQADLNLWRIRASVFAGEIGTALALLDSFAFSPGWHGAQESLQYRFALQRLRSSPPALRVWTQIEYTMYKGKARDAIELVSWGSLPTDANLFLYGRIAEQLLTESDFQAAQKLLSDVPSELATPRHRYYLAESLLRTGKLTTGQKLLKNLIVNAPHDVFSVKARLLLKDF